MLHAVDHDELLMSLEERVWTLRRRLNDVDLHVDAATAESSALKCWLRVLGDTTSLVLVDLEMLRKAHGSSWPVLDHAIESACRETATQVDELECLV